MGFLKNAFKKKDFSWVLLLCLLAFLVWGINLYFRPDFFSSPDAAIYADVARNIISGQEAASNITYPIFLAKIPFSLGPWPSPYPHFYPLALTLGFLIFGIAEISAAFLNGFFFVATLPFVYLLAKNFFKPQVAIWASIWYIFNPALLNFSLSGMSESLFTFLLVSSVYLFFQKGSKFLFLSGILVGLASLTRFQGALLFLPIFGLSFWQKKGGRLLASVSLLSGFLLPIFSASLILPPTALNYGGFQNNHLWAVISLGALIPERQIAQILEPPTFSFLSANLNLIFPKIIFNFYYLIQKIFEITLPSLVILYIFSFFLPLPRKILPLQILTLSLLVIFSLFHLLTIFGLRYFQPLLPLIIILGSGTLGVILEKFQPRKKFLLAAIFTFLFIIIPMFTSPGYGTSIQRSLTSPRKPTILYLLGQIVSSNTPPNAIIVTDRPAHIAWYGNRKSILVPPNPSDLAKIEGKLPIDALFLSNYYPEHFPEWQNLVENPHDFDNFHYVKSFEIKPEDNYYRIPIKAVLYLKTFKK